MNQPNANPTRSLPVLSALALLTQAGAAPSQTPAYATQERKQAPMQSQAPAQTHLNLLGNTLPLTLSDLGHGRPYLLLHGGAGPGSMMGLAAALSASARAVVPTHPGFQGQPRPEWFHSIADLATAYLELMETLDLKDVIVVGNSAGGWIAAEMALRNSPRVAGIVLMNSVGVQPGAHGKIADLSKVTPQERSALAFHDPAKFAIAPAGPEAAAMLGENQKTLRVYGGEHFAYDPGLRARLAGMRAPTLFLWGESDRVSDVAYGREFSESVPGARFETIAEAGHLPQIEKTGVVAAKVAAFAAGHP